jgi:hypothetical protein
MVTTEWDGMTTWTLASGLSSKIFFLASDDDRPTTSGHDFFASAGTTTGKIFFAVFVHLCRVLNTAEHSEKDFAVCVCEKAHGKENNTVITKNTHGKDLRHGKETKKHTVKNCTR